MSLKNLFGSAKSPSQRAFESGLPNPFYELTANDIKHQPFHFGELKGKVVLIVNVASHCGFTPQYAGLQTLFDKYKGRGFEIIGFPCSQFAGQEFDEETSTRAARSATSGLIPWAPTLTRGGTASAPRWATGRATAEIEDFCSRNYNVTFRLMEKIDVNGSKAHPVYQYLKEERPGILGIGMIKWNFEKFLIDRNGHLVQRYSSMSTPEQIEPEIEKLLNQPYDEGKAKTPA